MTSLFKKTLIATTVMTALAGTYWYNSTDTNSSGTATTENVFKFSFQGDIQGLDPQSHYETFQLSTLRNVYEGLVTRDETLSIAPHLATSWSMKTPSQWEFKLRKGVKFHNGNDFTAEDVKFTFERALGTDFKSLASKVEKVIVVDDHTVILDTGTPKPGLINELDGLLIMDKEWSIANGVEKVDTNSMDKVYTTNHANGTGPFKAVSYQAGVKSEFVRFDGHWDKGMKTNIDRVIFTPIGQDSTRVASLLSGAIDMAYPVPVQDQDRLNSADNVDALVGPELRNIFLGFDQWRDELVGSDVKGKNPFKDVRVRKAFALAIDNDLINKKVMRGSAYPTSTMVAQVNGYPGDDVAAVYPQDVTKAKELLAEAGYPNGFTVKMDCPNNRYVNDEKICQAVVSMLAKVNVKVDLLAQPKAQYFKKVLEGGGFDTSFYLLGWSPGSKDALDPLEYLISCRGLGDKMGPYNLGNYCNPQINDITAKARVEADPAKRNALIKQGYQIAKDEYGYVPIHNQSLSWGLSKEFSVLQRSDNVLLWRYVTKN